MSAPRTFDHNEAKELRAQGMTLHALAKRYNVSHSAIWKATTPTHKERHRIAQHRYEQFHQEEIRAKRRKPPCPSCGRHRCRLKACGNFRKR